MSASMEDALTEALLWDKDELADGRLTDADFGKRADGSGFWWHLRYVRDVKNSEVEDSGQDDEKRYSMIVRAWAKSRVWLDSGEPAS
jgi:hypothetical protein